MLEVIWGSDRVLVGPELGVAVGSDLSKPSKEVLAVSKVFDGDFSLCRRRQGVGSVPLGSAGLEELVGAAAGAELAERRCIGGGKLLQPRLFGAFSCGGDGARGLGGRRRRERVARASQRRRLAGVGTRGAREREVEGGEGRAAVVCVG